MKHGRRHNRLKEKAYVDRKDAEGYGRPYEPIPVEPPTEAPAAPPPPPPALTEVLDPRSRNALKRALEKRDEDP